MDYQRSSHAVFNMQYHIVLVVKYRKPCLIGDIAETCKSECIRILERYEGKVVDIETDIDYVHIVVSLGPRYAIAKIMNVLKGVTARILRRDYSDFIGQYLWRDSFWSDSYFIATEGDFTLDVLKQYVENQGKPKRPYHRKK